MEFRTVCRLLRIQNKEGVSGLAEQHVGLKARTAQSAEAEGSKDSRLIIAGMACVPIAGSFDEGLV